MVSITDSMSRRPTIICALCLHEAGCPSHPGCPPGRSHHAEVMEALEDELVPMMSPRAVLQQFMQPLLVIPSSHVRAWPG